MIPWIIISIALLLVLIAIIGFISIRKKGRREPDYYSLFIMGLIWLPFGFILRTSEDGSLGFIFIILGAIYITMGLSHKKDWKKNRRPYLIKNVWLRWLLVLGLAVLVFITGIYFSAKGLL